MESRDADNFVELSKETNTSALQQDLEDHQSIESIKEKDSNSSNSNTCEHVDIAELNVLNELKASDSSKLQNTDSVNVVTSPGKVLLILLILVMKGNVNTKVDVKKVSLLAKNGRSSPVKFFLGYETSKFP